MSEVWEVRIREARQGVEQNSPNQSQQADSLLSLPRQFVELRIAGGRRRGFGFGC